MKYAIINQAIISIIINVILNAAITWFYFRDEEIISMYGWKSISLDMLQANFYFTFYTCFFITRAVYGSVVRQNVMAIQNPPSYLRKHPVGYFFGSIILGIIVSLVFTPIIVGMLLIFDVHEFSLYQFILFKAIWGGLMALFWAPVFTLIALGEASEISEAPRSIWRVLREIAYKPHYMRR